MVGLIVNCFSFRSISPSTVITMHEIGKTISLTMDLFINNYDFSNTSSRHNDTPLHLAVENEKFAESTDQSSIEYPQYSINVIIICYSIQTASNHKH